MKSMNANETVLVCGGQREEFRTTQIHEIPRFENPPISLAYQTQHSEQSCQRPPLRPMPMHWLPPDGNGPQEY